MRPPVEGQFEDHRTQLGGRSSFRVGYTSLDQRVRRTFGEVGHLYEFAFPQLGVGGDHGGAAQGEVALLFQHAREVLQRFDDDFHRRCRWGGARDALGDEFIQIRGAAEEHLALVADIATLYRLGLEKAPAGSVLHGVGEVGISLRSIATAIGERLNLPVRSIPHDALVDHFGGFSFFIRSDCPASNTATRALLGWEPTGLGLIDDIGNVPLA